MPHDIESMFSYREVPWHGLGKVVKEAPDSEQALVLAGLNWAVIQKPVYVGEGTEFERIPDYWANARATDKRVLGIVKERYKVLQNREAFNWTDALLGEGIRYETAGALGEGREVWITAKLPQAFKVAGDPTDVYLLFSNSHDGSRAVRTCVTPVRTVCRNTLNLALKRAKRMWTTKHTGDMAGKLEEARRALGMVQDYMTELEGMADTMRGDRLPADDWMALVRKLMPVDETKLKSAAVLERNKARQQALYDRMLVPDLEAHRWTKWGAINAVADFADHASAVRPSEATQERQFEKVIRGHELVDDAMNLLGYGQKRSTRAAALV